MLSLYKVIYMCVFKPGHLVLNNEFEYLFLVKTISLALSIP